MHAFFSVFILVILVLTANASIMYQHASTTDIQNCLSDLTAAESSSTTTEKDFKGLTVQNIGASIEAFFKDTDDLVKTIQKASQSCCNPSVNNLVRGDNRYLSDEVGNYFKEANNIPNRAVSGGIIDLRDRLFSRVAQQVTPAAKTLERCIAERSEIDEAFKPAFAICFKLVVKIKVYFKA